MAKNTSSSRHVAQRAKKDEFYTRLVDIENEMKHFRHHFKNKVVYCNCDDPYESDFFKYFALNFNSLELKKLITTSYDGSVIAGEQLELFKIEGLKNEKKKEPYKIEINCVSDLNSDGAIDMLDVELLIKNDANVTKKLEGDGDFRSQECVDILETADIVVTNPPFSLFNEYLAQLMEFKKKFLIIGNINAACYKYIFPYIKNEKLWLGTGKEIWFRVPKHYEIRTKHFETDENGNKVIRVPYSNWFTNLDFDKRHEKIVTFMSINDAEYPKYDNYDAIEVNDVRKIPYDYSGVMGVPVTYLYKHNPDQFKIVGFTRDVIKLNGGKINDSFLLNGKEVYMRILIQRR